MRKQLGKKLVFAPLPVLILGTYGEDGTPCATNAPIAFDSAAAAYRTLGPVIAPAFKAGKAIK